MVFRPHNIPASRNRRGATRSRFPRESTSIILRLPCPLFRSVEVERTMPRRRGPHLIFRGSLWLHRFTGLPCAMLRIHFGLRGLQMRREIIIRGANGKGKRREGTAQPSEGLRASLKGLSARIGAPSRRVSLNNSRKFASLFSIRARTSLRRKNSRGRRNQVNRGIKGPRPPFRPTSPNLI